MFKPAKLIPFEEAVIGMNLSREHEVEFKMGREQATICRATSSALVKWYECRRPFLDLYPSLYKALGRTSLNIDPGTIPHSILHDIGTVEIRLPESCKIPSFFLTVATKATFKLFKNECIVTFAYFDTEERDLCGMYHQCTVFGSTPQLDPDQFSDDFLESEHQMLLTISRISLGIMLLARDPAYIEPILLRRDSIKKLDDEGKKRAAERAKKRGVYGFSLGRQVETSPHFRCPHFAIRHTGKGGLIPKLVPIKGSIVNKKLLDKVPTGYHDDEA